MATVYADRGAVLLGDLSYAVKTDVGLKRSENQDNYTVIEGEGFRFFCVADGMGGARYGGLASQLAVASLNETLTKGYLTRYDLSLAVERANKIIHEKSQESPDNAGMGTTLVGLCFTGLEFYIVNVGDSRAYRIRNRRIEQLTVDHSLVQELIKAGAIKNENRETNPISHMLTRSLGPAPQVEVDCIVASKAVCRGDTFVICSDGLYNMVSEEEILRVIETSDNEGAVQQLVDLANRYGGSDNITVMVVKAGSSFPEYDAEIEERESNQSHPTDTIEFDSTKLAQALRARRRQVLIGTFEAYKLPAICILVAVLAIALVFQNFVFKTPRYARTPELVDQIAEIPAVIYEDASILDPAPVSWFISRAKLAVSNQEFQKKIVKNQLAWQREQVALRKSLASAELAKLAEISALYQQKISNLESQQGQIRQAIQADLTQIESLLIKYQFSKFSELLKLAEQLKTEDPTLETALREFQQVSWKYVQSGQGGSNGNLVELRTIAVQRVRDRVRAGIGRSLEQLNHSIDLAVLESRLLQMEGVHLQYMNQLVTDFIRQNT